MGEHLPAALVTRPSHAHRREAPRVWGCELTQGSPPGHVVRGSPISITIHTSTLKQPSPPPSLIAPAVPAVLPPPAGEDDRSRSPFCHSSCFHMLVLPVRPCSCFLVSLARASSASSASMLVLPCIIASFVVTRVRCNSCFLRCNSCFVVTRASFVVTRSILSHCCRCIS